MAYLTQKEFHRAIELLADECGLQRLRDKLVRLNALVTRRKVASTQALADQLYMLTGNLRRQVAATYAFHHLWAESLQAKLGEDGEKSLEALAEPVNSCLGEDDQILAGKEAEIDAALAAYQEALRAAVGSETARLDMLLKAVPAVADRLRAAQVASAPEPVAPVAEPVA